MTEAQIRHIVIVGAGFCGTMASVHLLNTTDCGRLRIVLIDPAQPGPGLAYGTSEQKHLLNVPAGGMSAFENDPENFVRYLKNRNETISGGEFVPRLIYGDYLQSILDAAIANKRDEIEFNYLRTQVIDIRRSSAQHEVISAQHEVVAAQHEVIGGQHEVVCADGSVITADRIILALGNAPPKSLLLRNPHFFETSSRYIHDPWCADFLDRIDWKKPLLLIGTGLTAVDMVIKLAARRYRPPIYAVSRHGLQPIAHRGLSGKLAAIDLPSLLSGELSISKIAKFLRKKAAEIVAEDRDWRDIVAALRPQLPQLWQRLPNAERKRFLRHAGAYWDVHRHRLAPPVAASLQDLIASHRLNIMAARISTIAENNGTIDVRLRQRGKRGYKKLVVGTVINCTGPNTDLNTSRDSLTKVLLQRAILTADALKLGIEIDANYCVGSPHCAGSADLFLAKSIFYVGPWLKAKFWEATAVPELRMHVRNVVDNVLASLQDARRDEQKKFAIDTINSTSEIAEEPFLAEEK